jgi:hypothetical protein
LSRFKIDDFPPHVQAQIRAQLEDYKRPVQQLPADPIPSLSPNGGRKSPGPNKTELNYRQTILRSSTDVRFEAITFHMANGHRYTPDWIVFSPDGLILSCHECKGAYALHSQQRARLAFDQCAKEFPGLKWTWAVKKPEGWEITNVV